MNILLEMVVTTPGITIERAGCDRVTITMPERSVFVVREREVELLGRLRRGDHAAFEEIYAHFNSRLLSFLVRMTRDRAVAEDLLEETWLRLIATADDLDADTCLGPWLFTVARNLYVSYCRSRIRQQEYTADLVLLWPGELPQSPLNQAELHQFEERLEAAIQALPPLYREALLLVGVEQMKPADAASVCGISGEALRQRLSRARTMVRRFLAEREPVRRETRDEGR